MDNETVETLYDRLSPEARKQVDTILVDNQPITMQKEPEPEPPKINKPHIPEDFSVFTDRADFNSYMTRQGYSTISTAYNEAAQAYVEWKMKGGRPALYQELDNAFTTKEKNQVLKHAGIRPESSKAAGILLDHKQKK